MVQDFEQPTAAEAVAAGRADLAVCSEGTLASGLVAEPLWAEPLDRVIVQSGHPLAGRPSVTLGELAPFPFVFAQGTVAPQTGERIERALREAGLRSPIIALEGDLRIAHVAVATQRAWTLITHSRAKAPPDGTVVLALGGLAVAVEMIAVWRRDDRRALIQTVLRRMREVAGGYLESRVRVPAPSSARARTYRAPRPPGTVPPDLQLRHLRALVSVTSTPSISRAARRLGMSQPALSRQLRALEDAIGLSLFERSARGVSLTPAGIALAGDAPALLAAAEQIAREVDRVKRSLQGRCLIGTVATAAASGVLARVTARCAELYPELEIVVKEVPSAEQRAGLLGASIDLGLAHAMPRQATPEDEAIVTTLLFEDRLERALLARDHPLARASVIDAHQLADVPFVFMRRAYQPDFYDRVYEALGALGLQPRVEATYDAVQTAWSLVAQGKGWTLGFQSQRERPPAGIGSVRIAGFSLPFGIDLLSRRGESAPTVVAVVALLLESQSPPRARRARDHSVES
jgi:DNA-binding transcriptional LysR family regulator